MSLENATFISPALAVLLIEEGVAIKTSGGISGQDTIYQRNRKLNFFSFRKWRKTEDYAIQNELRDKIYYFEYCAEPKIITQSEFAQRIKNCTEITVVPPLGFKYTFRQMKNIHIESGKLVRTMQQFI